LEEDVFTHKIAKYNVFSVILFKIQNCTGYLGHLFGKTTVKGIPSLVAKDIQLRYNVKARTDARPAT
jgi:hypothetical protein